MPDTVSTSSLSSPPDSDTGAKGSDVGFNDDSIEGSGSDTESPLSAPQLRGGRKARRAARGKSKETKARKSDEIQDSITAQEFGDEGEPPLSVTSERSSKSHQGDGDQDSITAEKSGNEAGEQVSHKRKALTQGEATSKTPRMIISSGKKRTAQQKKWDAPFVMTDPKSPLVKTRIRNDLRNMLMLPGAWSVLTEDEQKGILALFPDESCILDAGSADARPNLYLLGNNVNFRSDCIRYTENISYGRHEDEWLHQAWVAHEKHRHGHFDQYLAEEFEDEWGVKPSIGKPPAEPAELEDDKPVNKRARRSAEPEDSSPAGSITFTQTKAEGEPATPEKAELSKRLSLKKTPSPESVSIESPSATFLKRRHSDVEKSDESSGTGSAPAESPTATKVQRRSIANSPGSALTAGNLVSSGVETSADLPEKPVEGTKGETMEVSVRNATSVRK